MADDVVVFHKPDIPLSAFPVMEDIRRRGKLCDVTLKVGDCKFSAHRIVLAASIPYFNAMFTQDMIESRKAEVEMQDMDPSSLESLINFAYSGKIQLDSSNVQPILISANFLHMVSVKEACYDFLKNRLHPNNVLGIKAFSEHLMCSILIESCTKYIHRNFIEVSKSEEFSLLSCSDLALILGSDELNVNNEEQVYEALINWTRKDAETRCNEIEDLLKLVRLPLLRPQFLSDSVAREDLVKNSLRCRDLIDEAKDYHLLPERRSSLKTFCTKPRCPIVAGVIYAVGGLTSSGDSISIVEFLEPQSGKWKTSEPMRSLRSRVGVSVLNGLLFAIGGYDGQDRLKTVEVLDVSTSKWKLVAPMLCCRSALGATSYNGKLYVCGGYDGVSSLDSAETYDPSLDEWSLLPCMERHRSASGVVALNGCIYAIGGHDGLSIFDSMECFNLSSGTWTFSTPMQTKRCRLGVAILNGCIFVAGGYDGNVFLKSAEMFNPLTNKWLYIQPMHQKRSRVALAACAGKLYAIGGYDGQCNLSTVEMYDSETNKWTFVAPMGAHEGGVGVGVVPSGDFNLL